jgi:HSP20 family protein
MAVGLLFKRSRRVTRLRWRQVIGQPRLNAEDSGAAVVRTGRRDAKEAVMKMMRWDPFRELEDMSTRLNRFFGQVPARATEEEGAFFADWSPAVDVEETDKEYLIKADLPAVKKEDVKVGIEEGILTVQGERKQEKEEKNKRFHRMERSYGKFVRRMSVPMDVDQQKVAAEFKDGVLNVHLPKSNGAKPRSVDIKVA